MRPFKHMLSKEDIYPAKWNSANLSPTNSMFHHHTTVHSSLSSVCHVGGGRGDGPPDRPADPAGPDGSGVTARSGCVHPARGSGPA